MRCKTFNVATAVPEKTLPNSNVQYSTYYLQPGVTHPAVVVPVENLGRNGFGVARFVPHFFPKGIVLGDIHHVVLDVLSIQDPGHFALLGFDLWGRHISGGKGKKRKRKRGRG